jgi:dolichol-phosphate mannosyltransferase
MLLLCLGVIGEYLGRVYDEVRSRPLSIISSVHRTPAMIAPQFGIAAVQASGDQDREETDAA